MTKHVEYKFVLPDGSKRYELIDPENEQSVMSQSTWACDCMEQCPHTRPRTRFSQIVTTSLAKCGAFL
jgi:hypothetical protein